MSGLTPAEWLLIRLDSPPDLRLMRNHHDAWDVVLRIDGGYRLEDAHRVLDTHRMEIEALVRRVRGEPDAA